MAKDSVEVERLGNDTISYIRRDGEYFIQFPHMIGEYSDPYGPCRWNADRFVREGEWTTNTSLQWLMEAMLANHSGISHPQDILYTLPAGNPHFNDNQKLKDIQPAFQPSAGRHAIILRLINIDNCHWVTLVHFHTINSIVVFNPLAVDGTVNPGSVEYTEGALLDHAKFVQGSAAVPKEPTELHVSLHNEKRLTDGWSCGLWCVGLAGTLLELLSERRALDGEAVDCTRLRDALVKAIKDNKVMPLTTGEAHRLQRRAWVLQQAPDIKFF